jgi:molybdopterin-containing oxidoreductase family membrane subunit
MIEKALKGGTGFWVWILFLLAFTGAGFISYLYQLKYGLTITGMGRTVSWGMYIANFTFFVGVAASAVTVVLPYYLHNVKEFAKITVLGEFLAVSAVVMSVLFIFVDLGQPARVFNIILYPTPSSLLFWDMIALNGYLFLNLIIGWSTLDAEYKGEVPRGWIKWLIILSIPWAISIHTVTAFIYSGLAARPFWLTALLAPRFLASAFSSGPALLVIIALILRRYSKFDVGKEALRKVSTIITYALAVLLFFLLVEMFTVFYSGLPEHVVHFRYLLFGLDGNTSLVPWAWLSLVLAFGAFLLLLFGRGSEKALAVSCVAVFAAMWIDKGLGLIVPGFVPSPLGEVTSYIPTVPELLITAGIWSLGLLLVTLFFRMTVAVKTETLRDPYAVSTPAAD